MKILKEPIAGISTVMIDPCAHPIRRCLPLFEAADIDWKSVRQQRILNCPLPATLAALARVCPKKTRGMIRFVLNEPYKSTLGSRRGSGPHVLRVSFGGARKTVTISPRLHYRRPRNRNDRIDSRDPRNLRFAKAADGAWISYIEKAYLALRGYDEYDDLSADSGVAPTIQRVFFDVAGSFDQIDTASARGRRHVTLDIRNPRTMTGRPGKHSASFLNRFLSRAAKKPTIAGTWGNPATLIGSHTYVVLNVSGQLVHVREFMRGGPTRKIRIGRFFRDEFDVVLQARGPCK